jgi:hypothetical protein
VGRARRRERLARQGGAPRPAAAAGAAGRAPAEPVDDERRLHDPQWRRAERRRIARLNRLPDPFRSWGDRSRAHAFAVAALQIALVVVLGMVLMRLTSGAWLPRYAAVVVLGLAVGSQAVCRSINRRADARAAAS